MMPITARRTTLVAAMLMVVAACSASPEQDGQTVESSPSAGRQEPTTASAPPTASGATGKVELGTFPEFPQGRLADAVTLEMQALLDAAVEEGAMLGISAAVIVAGSGSWSGAAGVDLRDRVAMSPASVLPTASVGKTVIAAQVLRLVEEEKLGLDDRAADHLPPELPERLSSRAGDVTIRELLGMRSGLADGGTLAIDDPGPTPVYANVNYDILAAIIDHVTGKRLPQVVRAGVLAGPGLDGLVFEADGERWPHDGHMRADAATMARWGYELYGGFVLSDASLRETLDFGGEWYGLGVIDFTHPDTSGGSYDSPSVGHGGIGDSGEFVILVAFPDTGVIVYLWALPDTRLGTDTGFSAIRPLVEDLRDAAHP